MFKKITSGIKEKLYKKVNKLPIIFREFKKNYKYFTFFIGGKKH
jgi:hypothetical protein